MMWKSLMVILQRVRAQFRMIFDCVMLANLILNFAPLRGRKAFLGMAHIDRSDGVVMFLPS